MAKQIINIGTAANARNGDPLRTAFNKSNENFTEMYDATSALEGEVSALEQDVTALESKTEFTHIELLDTEVVVGPTVTFVKTNFGSEVDYIDEGLAITRGINQGIYNVAIEEDYDRVGRTSPQGTEWNSEGWDNLENLRERTYTTWRLANDSSVLNQFNQTILERDFVMHDIANDKYYLVKWTQWTQGVNQEEPTGGGFVYERRLVDLDAGKGITFPDGSVQRKAVVDVSDLTDTEGLLSDGSLSQLSFQAGEGENFVSHDAGLGYEGGPTYQIRFNSHLSSEDQVVFGFDVDGSLSLPQGGDIVDSEGNSVLGPPSNTTESEVLIADDPSSTENIVDIDFSKGCIEVLLDSSVTGFTYSNIPGTLKCATTVVIFTQNSSGNKTISGDFKTQDGAGIDIDYTANSVSIVSFFVVNKGTTPVVYAFNNGTNFI